MGGMARRKVLENKLNDVFGAKNIRSSANRLKKLGPRADFLDISEALGCLDHIRYINLRRYRGELTIPPLIQRVLTTAYREALFHKPKPIPLRIRIRAGRGNSVQLKTTDRLIAVVLTRPDPKITARGTR
jgi:hypothetical protein